MNDEQLLRYSRQIMVTGVDIDGQQRLLDSRALIVGLGGLGSPAAMYLAAAGVGRLALLDHDQVELSNLQRQIIHHSDAVGRAKTESACRTVHALNPEVECIALPQRADDELLREQVAAADVVLDGTDNFATRFAVNAACVAAGTPLVSGAAIRMEGQIAVFRPDRPDSPCYRCLYQNDGSEIDQRCAENGVLAPVVGIIGSMQATEAIKVLLNLGEDLSGRLLLLDALHMEWRSLKLRKDPACPVCGPDRTR